MRRRTTTSMAVLCGGGPADGERRAVAEGVDAIDVDDPRCDGPSSAATTVRTHRYARRDEGRFTYAGPIERPHGTPGSVPAGPRGGGVAVPARGAGPSALAISIAIVLAALVLAGSGLLL